MSRYGRRTTDLHNILDSIRIKRLKNNSEKEKENGGERRVEARTESSYMRPGQSMALQGTAGFS